MYFASESSGSGKSDILKVGGGRVKQTFLCALHQVGYAFFFYLYDETVKQNELNTYLLSMVLIAVGMYPLELKPVLVCCSCSHCSNL